VVSLLLASVLIGALPPSSGSPTSSTSPASTESSTTSPSSVPPGGLELPAVILPLPSATLPAAAATVLTGLAPTAPAPTGTGLGAVLDPLLTHSALGRSVSAEVIDPATGAVLYSRTPTRAAVPASTAKVLTAAAALAALGPDATLPTRTVLAAPAAGPAELTLVGGGDVLLAAGRGRPDDVVGHAGLADLADLTAAALAGSGVGTVALRLDDTLFTGPAVNPAWPAGDVGGGFVAPVMPIELVSGLADPGHPPDPGKPAARLADPAMTAARQFGTLLTGHGITLSGAVSRAAAPAAATELARVTSAGIADVVEHALTESDNTAGEALARLVAVAAGRPATFADAGRAVLTTLAGLGVPVAGARMAGGSGLDTATELSADTIARTLALAASPDHPQLRAVLTGLPVAGASGTLVERFAAAGSAAGVGVVRAKTGTLTGVGSLAGTVVDADGRLLAFVVLADAVPATDPGRTALDQVATALAGCGCH
jgi:D-alanyl-D-alanine carboxypeptidase/D-alanyl-D-alanine-endopeptidase (penicillin-binding protein 4)